MHWINQLEASPIGRLAGLWVSMLLIAPWAWSRSREMRSRPGWDPRKDRRQTLRAILVSELAMALFCAYLLAVLGLPPDRISLEIVGGAFLAGSLLLGGGTLVVQAVWEWRARKRHTPHSARHRH